MRISRLGKFAAVDGRHCVDAGRRQHLQGKQRRFDGCKYRAQTLAPPSPPAHRRNLDIVYRVGDTYVPGAIEKLNYFLRDHRTKDVSHYDPKEFDLLHNRAQPAWASRTASSTSSAATARPGATTSCAPARQHRRRQEQAAHAGQGDRHPHPGRRDPQAPRHRALSLQAGGVGYYPVSQFVHVDVGPVRQWTFAGARRLNAWAAHQNKRPPPKGWPLFCFVEAYIAIRRIFSEARRMTSTSAGANISGLISPTATNPGSSPSARSLVTAQEWRGRRQNDHATLRFGYSEVGHPYCHCDQEGYAINDIESRREILDLAQPGGTYQIRHCENPQAEADTKNLAAVTKAPWAGWQGTRRGACIASIHSGSAATGQPHVP